MIEALAIVACLSTPGSTLGTHWSWYTIDGRRCWFVGKPRSVPRDQLRWEVPARASASEPEVPRAEWEVEHRWPEGVMR
jgi:hypothetical protein